MAALSLAGEITGAKESESLTGEKESGQSGCGCSSVSRESRTTPAAMSSAPDQDEHVCEEAESEGERLQPRGAFAQCTSSGGVLGFSSRCIQVMSASVVFRVVGVGGVLGFTPHAGLRDSAPS